MIDGDTYIISESLILLLLRMGPGQYASTGSGKLKLKGVKDSKVDKKKKKSASSNPKEKDGINVDEDVDDVFRDQSVMLKRLEEEDKVMAAEAKTAVQKRKDNGNTEPPYQLEETDTGEIVKTEAERRYEEQRRRRVSATSPSDLSNALVQRMARVSANANFLVYSSRNV